MTAGADWRRNGKLSSVAWNAEPLELASAPRAPFLLASGERRLSSDVDRRPLPLPLRPSLCTSKDRRRSGSLPSWNTLAIQSMGTSQHTPPSPSRT